jgi:hypothetical protein
MISLTNPTARAATAAAALVSAFFLASPSFAASSPAPSQQAMVATAPESPGDAPVDTRIKELHRRLHITDAQKAQWDNLAQVMRDNAQAMADLEKQRASDAKSMTAVAVVKSYSEVIQAHEDGMKKFIPAFEDLYNSMSDAQKKTADSLFRSNARTEAKKVASKAS